MEKHNKIYKKKIDDLLTSLIYDSDLACFFAECYDCYDIRWLKTAPGQNWRVVWWSVVR